MLPEAWISTADARHHRELVRYRAKLVALRSGLKAQVHAIIAKRGMHVPMTDLFGKGGRELLAHLLETDDWFASPFGQRIESLLVLIDTFDHEIGELNDSIGHVFADHAGYHAIQQIPGIGPVIAAIMVAEIGRHRPVRFCRASRVVVWPHPTPPRVRHQGLQGPDHQTRQPARALGRGRSRPETPQRLLASHPTRSTRRTPQQPSRRQSRDSPQDRHARLLRPPRRRDPLPATDNRRAHRRSVTPQELGQCANPTVVMTPTPMARPTT